MHAVKRQERKEVEKEDKLRARADLRAFPGGRTDIIEKAMHAMPVPPSRNEMWGSGRFQ